MPSPHFDAAANRRWQKTRRYGWSRRIGLVIGTAVNLIAIGLVLLVLYSAIWGDPQNPEAQREAQQQCANYNDGYAVGDC